MNPRNPRKPSSLSAALLLAAVLAGPPAALAGTYSLGSTGFELSGDLALTFRQLDRHTTINTNNRGDDPFSTYRVRLFVAKSWERVDLDVELLWDQGARARVQGAYLTFREIPLKPTWLQVGLVPSPFGNFAHRSTYFNQNPLIGVPAMWHYHTPFLRNGTSDNASLFPRRRWDDGGMPMAYDACWDMGAVLGWEQGVLETKAALTIGTLSNTRAYTNDGYQGTLTAGIHPHPGFRTGGSVAWGPWMSPEDYNRSTEEVEYLAGTADHHLGFDFEEQMQTAVGGYAEMSFGRWQFFSEAMWIEWESPLLAGGALSAASGYLEGEWTFLPGWYLATRYDVMLYSEISSTNDGSGRSYTWSYDFDRIETALGWRVLREGFIRLDYQGTFYRLDGPEDVHLLALQFLFAF